MMLTPQDLNLPGKFKEWRLGQYESIDKIASGKERLFMLDSPPGTGKSVIAVAVHRILELASGNQKCVFVTRTKQLQSQITSEFSWTRSLKGRSNYPCVTGETMAVGPGGPKKVQELKVGDEIYTLSPNGEIQVQAIENLYVSPIHSTEIISTHNSIFQMDCTLNHRVLLNGPRPDYSGRKLGYFYASAENLRGLQKSKGNYNNVKRIPTTGKWVMDGDGEISLWKFIEPGDILRLKTRNYERLDKQFPYLSRGHGKGRKFLRRDLRDGDLKEMRTFGDLEFIGINRGTPTPIKFKAKDFMSFIGWYASEGHAQGGPSSRGHRNFGVCISQNPGEKQDEIVDLCKRMGLHYIITKSGHTVMLNSQLLHRAVRYYCPGKATTKELNREVLDKPIDQLHPLLNSLIEGDGHIGRGNGMSYATTSEKLAFNVAEIAIKLGYSPRITYQKGGNFEGSSEFSCKVGIRRKYHSRGINLNNLAIEQRSYTGLVWCPTTANNNFLAYLNGNYFFTGNCLLFPNKFPEMTADDCTHDKKSGKLCSKLNECPYLIAKSIAVSAPLAVLNTPYFLAEINGPSQFGNADLVVLDEFDAFDTALLSFIELTISERQLKQYRIEPPKQRDDLQRWINWLPDTIARISLRVDSMKGFLPTQERFWSDVDIQANKQVKHASKFVDKLSQFQADVSDNWVFYQAENSRNETTWTFKPVMVAPYADRYLWKHGKRFLGMSGTILGPKILIAELGLDGTPYGYEKLDCTFPVKNRPIYYYPVVNLTNKTIDSELPELAGKVAETMSRYPDKKMLVHTVSNYIRDYLLAHLPSDRVITHDTETRDSQLEKFKASSEPLAMFSPSFDRGIDLPDDFCRAIIICKVPYISLGDLQVQKRLQMPNGNLWYLLKACQTIVQMSFRGLRSMTDTCDCWILDRQFSNLRFRAASLLPAWWLRAIQEVKVEK